MVSVACLQSTGVADLLHVVGILTSLAAETRMCTGGAPASAGGKVGTARQAKQTWAGAGAVIFFCYRTCRCRYFSSVVWQKIWILYCRPTEK